MMNIPNMVRNAGRASLLLIFGAALAGCNAPSATQDATPPLAGAKIGGPFSLIDQDGKVIYNDFHIDADKATSVIRELLAKER